MKLINDIGTTNIKSIALIDNQEYRFVIPTAIGPVRPLEFGQATGINDYFVGQSAIDYSPNLIWGRDDNWLMSDYYRLLHLYCVARGIDSHIQHLKSSKQGYTHLLDNTWDVNLVTAVPYANWSQRNEIAAHLTGEYEVKLIEADYSIKVKINSQLKNKKHIWPRVMLQGWSAFLANGRPADNPGQPYVVVIGLGGRNIVYATMKNDNGKWTPVDGLVGSSEGGILDIIENLSSRIERRYRIELNHQQAIQALKDCRIAGHDITDLCSEVSQPYIDALLSIIAERWNERRLQPFIQEIRLTGGGSILLGERVKHRLITVSENGLWDEAEGMKAVV